MVLAQRVLTDDDRLDFELGDELEIVDRREVRGIGHRYGKHPPDPTQREDKMLESDVPRDELQDLLVHRDLVEIDRGDAVLLRKHSRELFLLDEAQVDQRIPDPVAFRLRDREAFLQLLLRDQTFPNEQVSETNLLGSLGSHRRAILTGGNRGRADAASLNNTGPYRHSTREVAERPIGLGAHPTSA